MPLWSNFYLLIFASLHLDLHFFRRFFRFQKCEKYANEMTDDVIHSTQYHIMYLNKAILANLQRRPMKPGSLIVPHLRLWNILFPWQLTLSHSPPTWFQYVSDFQPEKRWKRPQTQANIFVCLLDHVSEAPFANMKLERQRWPEMPLILRWPGTQYVAVVTKLWGWNCGAHLVESYCKESNISDTNWLRYPFSSYLFWLSVWRHHLTKKHLL